MGKNSQREKRGWFYLSRCLDFGSWFHGSPYQLMKEHLRIHSCWIWPECKRGISFPTARSRAIPAWSLLAVCHVSRSAIFSPSLMISIIIRSGYQIGLEIANGVSLYIVVLATKNRSQVLILRGVWRGRGGMHEWYRATESLPGALMTLLQGVEEKESRSTKFCFPRKKSQYVKKNPGLVLISASSGYECWAKQPGSGLYFKSNVPLLIYF